MPVIDVNLIEERLGMGLPSAYRRLLSDYPQRVHDTKTDLTWKQEPISERELYGDAERIIQANLDQRRCQTPWFSEEIEPWPGHMLVIGDDQCGNYWCIDVTAGDGAVVLYNHDVGAFEADSDSLAEYVQKTIRWVEEFNLDYAGRRTTDGGGTAK